MSTTQPRPRAKRRRWWGIALYSVLVLMLLTILAVVLFLAAWGNANRSGEITVKPPSKQACLRAQARHAPRGGAAYWLGASYRHLPVQPRCRWESYTGPFTTTGYYLTTSDHAVGGATDDLIIIVFTVPRDNTAAAKDFVGVFSRMHVANDQDVILVFQRVRPSAEVIRQTRAAVRPIPRDVTYPD